MFRRNLVLFIRRNKKKIITIVICIILLCGISFLASIGLTTINKIAPFFSLNDSDAESVSKESQTTIIYGDNIKNDEYLSDEQIIENFIDYCNDGKVKEAYELISQDCKERYYSTEKNFEELYYDQIFYVAKLYELQSWISYDNVNTYKVKLITDTFDMGTYDDSDYIEEYYTIFSEDAVKKISINRYVKNVEINKNIEDSGIKIDIESKDQYIDYEIYTIKVENNTNNTIALDSRETTSSIYLMDDNNVKYSSYVHELLIDELLVEANSQKVIEIKFNKMYNQNIEINKMVFSDVIMNYKNESEFLKIEILL